MTIRNVGWRLARALAPLALAVAIAPATLAAPAEPPPLEAYGDLPGVEQMTLSPSGKGLAFVARVKGVRQLVVLDGDLKVRAMLAVGDAKVRDLEWGDEGHVIASLSTTSYIGPGFTKDTMEFYYATIIGLDGSKPRTVFANDRSMVTATFGRYGYRTVGDKHFGYFGGLELKAASGGTGYEFDTGQPALFAVDLETMAKRRIGRKTEEGRDRDWLVDARGEVAATFDLNHASGSWTISNATGSQIAKGTDKSGNVSLVALGRDGSSVIYSRREENDGENHRYEQPLAGGVASEILPDIRIRRIFTDPANGQMIGYMPDSGEGAGVPVLYDADRQAKLRKVYRAFPKLDVRVVDFTQDIGNVLAHTSGNSDPGTWYLVDLAARKADPVGNDRPRIPSEMVGAISTVSYKAADGLEMSGILTLPPGREAKNLPVVMLPHGGPRSHDDANFDWWAQALASRGYAVFQPNFRGSTNRGQAFIDAGNGEWGRKMQTDISDGLAELARQGIVDPKRACIVGASYGGYAALAGVTLQKGLYKCAVAVAPVSDVSEMYYTDIAESGDDPLTKRALKEELGDPSKLAAVSPRRHAADADAPVLLIHGKDDTVVPYRHSTRMLDALRDAKKPVELVTLLKEDHWLSRAETRKQMLAECVRFVMANNPPN